MTTRRTLFAAALLLMGAALLTSCQKEADLAKEEAPVEVPEGSLWLSLEASKVADTKALALDGSALNAYWNADESVKVFLEGAYIGTLNATPNGTDNTKATLSGTVSDASGLAENAVLTLLFPRETWDYTGQAGTLASIEANYDYAAAEVEVVSVDGTNVTTTRASFVNRQSIYKLTFTGLLAGIASVTIHSAGNKLVASSAVGGSQTYGDITVTLDNDARSANGDGVVYAALRFNALEAGQTEELTITVTDTGTESNTYVFTKTSPSGGFTNGKYYTSTMRRIRLDDITERDGKGQLYVAAQDGDIITGDFMYEGYITVAKDAAVTLQDANTTPPSGCDHAAIHCLGSAHIILNGNNNMEALDDSDYPAILAAHNDSGIGEEYTLTFSGDGILNADGIGGGNGIPCGNIVIAGGIIDATGGQNAAGIGSGSNSSCGTITISGGQIIATGGQYAAGIGSGQNGSCRDITISGGIIGPIFYNQGGAFGGRFAAGIGSGLNGSCTGIIISGGEVKATGGESAAGIGSGFCDSSSSTSECGNITISGGTIWAEGGTSAAGIGSGRAFPGGRSECDDITITGGIDYLYAAKNGKWNSSSICLIGYGSGGTCGTVTIAGEVMAIDEVKYFNDPKIEGFTGTIGSLYSSYGGWNWELSKDPF